MSVLSGGAISVFLSNMLAEVTGTRVVAWAERALRAHKVGVVLLSPMLAQVTLSILKEFCKEGQ